MGRPHRSGRCRWASAPSLWGAAAACRHRRGAPALSMRGDGGGSSGGGGGADPPPLPRPADADDRDDPDAAAAADGGGRGRSDAAGGAFVVDMDALRQRLSSATAAKRGGSDGSSNTGVGAGGGLVGMGVSADQEESFRAATVLHVILFPSSGHSGDPSSGDGLYTVQMGVVNVVLAFAEVDDAKRYALMLQALDFPAPGVPMNVTAVTRTELQSFCDEDGHRLGFVPTDAVVTPPDGAAADAKAWLDSSGGASTASSSPSPSPPPPSPPLSREDRELRDRLNRLYDQ